MSAADSEEPQQPAPRVQDASLHVGPYGSVANESPHHHATTNSSSATPLTTSPTSTASNTIMTITTSPVASSAMDSGIVNSNNNNNSNSNSNSNSNNNNNNNITTPQQPSTPASIKASTNGNAEPVSPVLPLSPSSGLKDSNNSRFSSATVTTDARSPNTTNSTSNSSSSSNQRNVVETSQQQQQQQHLHQPQQPTSIAAITPFNHNKTVTATKHHSSGTQFVSPNASPSINATPTTTTITQQAPSVNSNSTTANNQAATNATTATANTATATSIRLHQHHHHTNQLPGSPMTPLVMPSYHHNTPTGSATTNTSSSSSSCRGSLTRVLSPIVWPLYLLIIHVCISEVLSSTFYESQVLSSTDILYEQPVEQKCQPLNTEFCNITTSTGGLYSTVDPFRNTLGHNDLNTARAELHKYGYLFKTEQCNSKIQLFLCSLYAPVCVKSTVLLLPCKEDCKAAKIACEPVMDSVKTSWPAQWDCERFKSVEDDKMCVINNSGNNSIPVTSGGASAQPTTIEPPFLPEEPEKQENETICAKDLFDCQLHDQSRNMKALCIERNLVCDGKYDCVIDGIDSVWALDEVGCEKNCNDKFYCDGKCLDKSDICNGKVDCISGADEENCYVYPIKSILLIVFMFLVVALYTCISSVRRLWTKPKIFSEDFDAKVESVQESCSGVSASVHTHAIYHNYSVQQRTPIYQELAYSIGTRSDYERVNVGGYSGASSVYGSYYAYHPPSLADEVPAAPPPTPAIQSPYRTDSALDY